MRNGDGNGNRAVQAGDGASVLADVVKGAIAGAVGTWAMDKITWIMWDRQDPATLRQEEQHARTEGLDPAHATANRVARAFGTQLQPRQPHPAGVAVHYGIGTGPAMVYAPLRRRLPALGAAGGLLYGLGLFLAVDEGVVPALGLAGAPTEYPWQTHVRGLVGHLVLGAVTHATLELLDQAV